MLENELIIPKLKLYPSLYHNQSYLNTQALSRQAL